MARFVPSRAAAGRRPRRKKRPLLRPFLASAALNALLLWLSHSAAGALRQSLWEGAGGPPAVLDITALPTREAAQEPAPNQDRRARRIVSNTNANGEEPPDARYIAEQASRVEQETQGAWGRPRSSAPPGAPASGQDPNPPNPRKPAGKGEPAIFPSQEQLAKLLPGGSPLAIGPDSQIYADGDHLETLDPSVPQGAYTFLNAKSSKYAGFVNRTATRVFDYFVRRVYSQSTLASLHPADEGVAVVQTILDPTGQPMGTTLLAFSGAPTLAESARYAMEQGVWDLNPPRGAAREDGTFQLVGIFRLRYLGRQRYQYSLRYGVM